MRMLVNITIPNEKFNNMMKKGNAGATLGKIIESTNPEFIYFTEHDGYRGAVMAVDVKDASHIPSIVEPWFLSFDAECNFKIAMSPQDLQNSDLDNLAKGWT